MGNKKHTFTDGIPQGACTLVVGEIHLGDNGDDAKSAPVSLIARSGRPIEHWFWGRVVHDLSGMQLHKPRIPIDYVHDSKEIVGYLNKFETETGDLVTSGALTPFKDSDRATEIIFKSRAGVPYEASINFGGDGIKIQEVNAGELTMVNGSEFEGPGVVIREWPLRGVAVCPYGADMNTDSTVLSGNKKYSATVFTEPETVDKDADMRNVTKSVDSTAEAVQPEAVVEEDTQTVDTELAEVAEEASVDAEVEEVEEPEETETDELGREEFCRIVDMFGADIAAQTVKDGGNYQTALEMAYTKAKQNNDDLTEQVKALHHGGTGAPVPVSQASTKTPLIKIK